jgi:hypothetical protein
VEESEIEQRREEGEGKGKGEATVCPEARKMNGDEETRQQFSQSATAYYYYMTFSSHSSNKLQKPKTISHIL